jgi:hypothetical protein
VAAYKSTKRTPERSQRNRDNVEPSSGIWRCPLLTQSGHERLASLAKIGMPKLRQLGRLDVSDCNRRRVPTMPVSMYTVSIPVFIQHLNGLNTVLDKASAWAGRLSGKELLKFANDETTIAQLKDRIAKTIDYLKSIKQSEIDGTETKDISIAFPSGQTRQFTGQSLLLGNSLPNFYFHAATAYDIIRQCGVEIGKRDFMGIPPT